MKNAWFVLLLLASILTHAAIIDAARLAPVPASPRVYAPCPPPAMEARGDAEPAEIDPVGKPASPAGDLARGEPVWAAEGPEWRLVAGR